MFERGLARRLSEKAFPVAEELLSNEIYVFVSAIAMNALLSLFPFIILLVSVATTYFPHWQVHTMTYEILRAYLPLDETNQDFVIRNLRIYATGFGKIHVLSLIVLIWSIANIFIPLEMALNRTWQVKEARSFWKSQRLAMAVVVIGGVLAFLFIAGAAATAPSHPVLRYTVIKMWMVPLTILMFFLTFYTVPNTRVSALEILPAALVTGLLWELSFYAFTWIAPFLGFREIYGPFIITVTLMTWAYVSGIILLFGANLLARKMLPPGQEVLSEGLSRARLVIGSALLRKQNPRN
ncbi:MAG: YihY/virulence factor BrkB family protein [Acidobacteria bacterium]|nr:YihY/virulence factor BrkB family protein [Acidobacteriota bacterium]